MRKSHIQKVKNKKWHQQERRIITKMAQQMSDEIDRQIIQELTDECDILRYWSAL